jgi:hypothetical protein
MDLTRRDLMQLLVLAAVILSAAPALGGVGRPAPPPALPAIEQPQLSPPFPAMLEHGSSFTLAATTAVFVKPFTAVTAPTASAAMPNIGQRMHLIAVFFPAEVATVTGLQIRIEASYDGASFFPISPDITRAPLLGGVVYQLEKAYGNFPFVRVRNVTATGGPAMTVYYSGHLNPVVPFITQTLDRFIL